MGKLTQYDISLIEDRAISDLESLIQSAGGRVTGNSGREITLDPPCHASDGHKSFCINTTNGLFLCRSCGAKGNVVQLFELLLHGGINNNFRETVDWLCTQTGVCSISSLTPEQIAAHEAERKEREKLYEYYESLTTLAVDELWKNPNLVDHIKAKWGYSEETLRGERIGYYNAAVNATLKTQFPIAVRGAGGLYATVKAEGPNEGKFINIIRNRIIFPVIKNGQPVNFTFRAWSETPSDEFNNSRKYLRIMQNSEERPYINKHAGRFSIYGFDRLRDASPVIAMSEGPTDADMVTSKGGVPCVGLLTNRLSSAQAACLIPELKRGNKSVILIADSDQNGAGLKGALESAQKLECAGVKVKILQFSRPDGTEKIDACDWFKAHDKNDFNILIEQAKTPFDIRLEEIQPDADMGARVAAVQALMPSVARLPKVEAEIMLDRIKGRSGLNLTILREMLAGEVEKIKSKKLDAHGAAMLIADEGDVKYDPYVGWYLRDENVGTYHIVHGDHLNKYVSDFLAENCGDSRLSPEGVAYELKLHDKVIIPADVKIFNQEIDGVEFWPLENGLLDPLSGKMIPHSAEHPFSFRFPVAFDPAAKCPYTEEAITRTLRDPQVVSVFLEFIATSLSRRRLHENFVFLYGAAGSGKSTLINLAASIHGPRNTASVNLASLSERFALSQLIDKTLVVSNENSSREIETETLKKLVSRDPLMVEIKGRTPFTRILDVALLQASNEPLSYSDAGSAMKRRVIPLKSNVVIPECERDTQFITRRLVPELPGFLNLLIESYRRFVEAGCRFTSSDVISHDSEEFAKSADPLLQYVDECLAFDDVAAQICKSELYHHYKNFCDGGNYRPLSTGNFFRRLVPLMPESVRVTQVRLNGERTRVVQGLKFSEIV